MFSAEGLIACLLACLVGGWVGWVAGWLAGTSGNMFVLCEQLLT